jgi:hypothetical protein
MLCALISNGIVKEVKEMTDEEIQEVSSNYSNIVDVTNNNPRPQIGWSFDGIKMIAPAGVIVPVSMKITKLALRQRLTIQELMALQVASQTSIFLQVLKDNLTVSTFIDLARADTIAGIGALVSMGILTADRAATILTMPPSATEIYKE